ncbi:hypothetical protein D0Z00_001948 [Geotrichum galactomycetum]|uniref:Uncharacterized protein n=1 Tax=Geotrichum galactomycetum TaxID=27317 RepID=A0ACB6V5I4_9ASCO|nr:hypothetical protein D0Z00_001948 [Geotrichum candidum]
MSWDDENDLDIVHLSSDNDHRGLSAVGGTSSTTTYGNSGRNNAPMPNDDDADADVLGIDEEVVVKKRRTMAKLDDDRLINPNMGIPYLQRKVVSGLMPRLKKRKGEELRDLSTILQFYQLWAHKLYPKANFGDFIQIARTAGKTPRMRMFRQGWISDEKAKKLGIDAVQGEDKGDAENDSAKPAANDTVSAAGKNNNSTNATGPSNTGNLFVGHVNEDEFDGIDFDDDFDDDVFNDTNSTAKSTRTPTISSNTGSTVADTIRDSIPDDTIPNVSQARPARPRNAFIFDDDDDELDLIPSTTSKSSLVNPSRGVPDDDDMNELMAASVTKPAPAAIVASKGGVPDEDEMDELLREDYASKVSKLSTGGVPDEDEMDELLRSESRLALDSTSKASANDIQDEDDMNELVRTESQPHNTNPPASTASSGVLNDNNNRSSDKDLVPKSAAVPATTAPSKPGLKRVFVPISTGSPNEAELEDLLGPRPASHLSPNPLPQPEAAAPAPVADKDVDDDDMAELLHAESLLNASKVSESTPAPVSATATGSIHGIPDEDVLAELLGNPVLPESKQQQNTSPGLPHDIEDFEQDAFESMQDLGF